MPVQQRFLALDVFRGMTICLMIIVNTPGNSATTFAPFIHARWNGFTPTDLVFPSFLFAVGNAMSFVMPAWAGKKQSEVLLRIFKRTALIFLFGYLMYWFPFLKKNDAGGLTLLPISETRILGVLQRIALCYCIASLMIYYLKPKVSLIVCGAILLLYWGACFWWGDASGPLTLTGNAGLKLDRWLMGENHMYHGEGLAFDPEGWFSTLPAVANVMAGFAVGQYVQRKGKTYESIATLLLAGCCLLVAAYCWNFGFPINKKLWTSSFVLHTVGLDCIILAAVIYLIDILHRTKWTWFFEVPGKNPLAVYLLSELMATVFYLIEIRPGINLHQWVYLHVFSYAGAYTGSLLYAIVFMLLCWYAGYLMHKKRIYIKV